MSKVAKTGKNKYNYAVRKKKSFSLEPGERGFLCTSNFQENNCVREAYNLLNEYADRLYGNTEQADKQDQDEDIDISDALQKQIADMKPSSKKKNRFLSVMTHIQSYSFIKTELEDPIELALAIVKDIEETKIQKTRFLLRLIPIEVTCSIKINDIIDTAGKLFDKHFLCEPTTFSIVFSQKCSTVSKDEVISNLYELVRSKNPLHKTNLTNPKKAVIVEVIKSVCLLSVLPDYKTYKKYNLVSLCSLHESESSENAIEDKNEKTAEEITN